MIPRQILMNDVLLTLKARNFTSQKWAKKKWSFEKGFLCIYP